MHLNPQKSVKVVILLVVIVYLFTDFALLLHNHHDGVSHNDCIVCYYSLNYQSQQIFSQVSADKCGSFLIFDFFEPSEHPLIIVFLHDPCRAPPQAQTV